MQKIRILAQTIANLGLKNALLLIKPETGFSPGKIDPRLLKKIFPEEYLTLATKKHKIKKVVIMAKNGPTLLARRENREKNREKITRENFS